MKLAYPSCSGFSVSTNWQANYQRNITRVATTGRPKKGNLAETFTNSNTDTTSVFDAFKDIVQD